MSHWEPVLYYSNCFPRCMYYPFRIWNSWCDIHRLCVRWWLQCNLSVSLCLEDGGTRGNSCLGRRFLWASRSGHIHKDRPEARWDSAPIYRIWMWVCVHFAGCMCLRARAFFTDSTTDSFTEKSFTVGIFGWNTKQTILEKFSRVSKWSSE